MWTKNVFAKCENEAIKYPVRKFQDLFINKKIIRKYR